MWKYLIRSIVFLFLVIGFIGLAIQPSFPAFAVFFVSLLILIYFHLKDTAAKMSLSTLDLLINRQRLPKRSKLILIAIGISGISIILGFLLPLGFQTYPFLVIFGACSFAITILTIMLLSFIGFLFAQWRYVRHDFKTWKDSIFSTSLATRYQAVRALASINDPVLNKFWKICNITGFLCLLIWFVILLMVICTVLYLDYIGVWDDLVNKYK